MDFSVTNEDDGRLEQAVQSNIDDNATASSLRDR